MTRSVYLVGGPGTGKSTIMAHLLSAWDVGPYVRLGEREVFGHWLYNADQGGGVYLGHLRPEYPGTDAFPLSACPHAIRWMENLMPPETAMLYGEGFRLGCKAFLEPLGQLTDMTVVHLLASPEVAAQRQAQRPGSNARQKDARRTPDKENVPITPQHVKASITRAANAAAWAQSAGHQVLTLDTTDISPEDLALAVDLC